jgi:hypothetical protein
MSDNVLTRIRDRMQARRLRRKLTPEARLHVDRMTAEIWSECRDIGEAEIVTQKTMEMQGARLGFDPMTIMMIVQLAILIYKALKHFGVLQPTPEFIAAMFESEGDDQ